MKKVEAAYIAGIVDGEGTISISVGMQSIQRGKYRVKVVTKLIRITNTDIRLLYWLGKTTKVGHIKQLWQNPSAKYDRFRKGNIKPLYAWTIWGGDIKPFLAEIIPYLILKRGHAELMLESLRLSWARGNGRAYADDVWHRQVEIANEIKQLNKRGILHASM